MQVTLVDADPGWPATYELLRRRIVGALGERIVTIAHVGSTSVPGLSAKPVIDIVVEIDDAADEPRYLPAVQLVGFELRRREPDWYEHRVFRLDDPASNLHVFGVGCDEVARMLRFRDRLRVDAADRDRYEQVKRELAAQDWSTVQHYADAKSDVVTAILARADERR
ncbi:MAG: GrpB family protein [Ilumatobacteraceae bacterium]